MIIIDRDKWNILWLFIFNFNSEHTPYYQSVYACENFVCMKSDKFSLFIPNQCRLDDTDNKHVYSHLMNLKVSLLAYCIAQTLKV